jgi:hypothetical protein
MQTEFPEQCRRLPEKCGASCPPVITTLYVTFPTLHAELLARTNCLQELQNINKLQREQLNRANRCEAKGIDTAAKLVAAQKKAQKQAQKDVAAAADNNNENESPKSPVKRKRKLPFAQSNEDDTKAEEESATRHHKQTKLAAATDVWTTPIFKMGRRNDVPADVKEYLELVRKHGRLERARLHKQVSRLQEKVAATQAQVEAQVQAQVRQQVAARSKSRHTKTTTKAAATFADRLAELERFRSKHGRCRVPIKLSDLGRWVSELRAAYKGHTEEILHFNEQNPSTKSGLYDLTRDRIASLEKLGMEWVLVRPSLPWEERYEQLVQFKAKHGHCVVRRDDPEIPGLGEWVHVQRRQYREKNPNFQGYRQEKLDALGFVWQTHQKPAHCRPFEDRLKECQAFRREHGHLSVPVPVPKTQERPDSYPSDEIKSFRWWAQQMRDEHRKFQNAIPSRLTLDWIQKLNALKFAWTNDHKEFKPPKPQRKPDRCYTYDQRIEMLKEIKETYGDFNDLNVLKKAGQEENSSLHLWIFTQRKEWKQMQKGRITHLTPDRLQKLEEIGFDFAPRKHYAAAGSVKAEKRAKRAAQQAVEDATNQLDDSSIHDDDNDDSNDSESEANVHYQNA